MTGDELRIRALRSSVEALDGELGALWSDVAGAFGEDSRAMRELYRARKSCNLVVMQQTLDSLRQLLRPGPELLKVERELAELLPRTKQVFGADSPQVRRINNARAGARLDEMRQVLVATRRELQPRAPLPHWGPKDQTERSRRPRPPVTDQRVRTAPVLSGTPESFREPATRLPLPPPQRKPVDRPAPRRAGPKPRPPQPLGLKGGARRCSCGNVLAMPSDDVCYQCKPE